MRATIVDIKNRTGLSLATISKYLNGGKVRPENKAKIDEAVEALHYQVNETARSLVTNRTHCIGVIVYKVENLFVGTMVRYIGEFFRRFGYSIFICDSNNDREAERLNIISMVQKNVDGIILMPVSEEASQADVHMLAGVPVVCLDRKCKGLRADSVTVNNEESAQKLTEILIENGHRKIAYLGSDGEYTGKRRLLGFREAMNKAGLKIPHGYEYLDQHSMSTGHDGMRAILALPNRPSAVLSSNYEVTLGAVVAIHEASLSYPEDISLVAFDNLLHADVVVPRITVAVQPMGAMANAACRLLLNRIEAKGGSEEISEIQDLVFFTQLEKHESVRRLE